MTDTEERKLDSSCPTCEAPAESGQLVCLECGSRIALAYRRPPSWKLPVAIVAVVGVLAMAGAVVAYEAIDDDAKEEVAGTPLRPKKRSTVDSRQSIGAKDRPERTAAAKPKAEPKPSTTAQGLVRKGALYSWPRDLRAFTVVLLSSEDRASATTFARSVAKSGDAKIGVIRADDFETLPKGFFVVFAGSYKTRARADRATARLGRKYQGAFPQLVRR